MHRSTIVNAETEGWLAALTSAVDDAQRLVWRLGTAQGEDGEAMAVYRRLEVVRTELESIRNCGWAKMHAELSPEWIDLLHRTMVGLLS